MHSRADEQVLCTPASELPPEWMLEAAAIPLTEQSWQTAAGKIRALWVDRASAETNATLKQWIAYIVLRNHRGEIATYPRQGTEARLHGLWSVGLGGHVNPIDGRQNCHWSEWIFNAMKRELDEELPGVSEGRSTFLGLIQEHRTQVGLSHIGVVYLHDISGPCEGTVSHELTGLRWEPPASLGVSDASPRVLELWSQLALDLLKTHPLT